MNVHRPLATLVREGESTEKRSFCLPGNDGKQKIRCLWQKDEHLLAPAGMASLIPLSSPDGIRKIWPLRSLRLCGEQQELI